MYHAGLALAVCGFLVDAIWSLPARGPSKFHTRTFPCVQNRSEESLKLSSKSQHREDIYLYKRFFHGLCNGSYIELGALDGVRLSNSHLFNSLSWTGVLIEANSGDFMKLKVNRPHETLFHEAVCKEEGEVHIVEDGATGGIWEFMTEEFRRRWHRRVDVSKLRTILCSPLQNIIDRSGRSFFDFISLDVEGAELSVLKSVDFEKTGFGVVLVESKNAGTHERKNMAVRSFLNGKGYLFLYEVPPNMWFINSQFDEIYEKHMIRI